MKHSLRAKAFVLLIGIFLMLTAAISWLQITWVDRLVIQHTTDQMRQNIKTAWQIVHGRKRQMATVVELLAERPELRTDAPHAQPEELLRRHRERWGIHYLQVLDPRDLRELELARFLNATDELQTGIALAPRGRIMHARRDVATTEPTMILFAAQPLPGPPGAPRRTLLAAYDLRRGAPLVDEIQHTLFPDVFYHGVRKGTATVFLGDERIATTVLLESGSRAIGTRVSDEVAEQTLGRAEPWSGRALVVDHWYISRYDPIRNPAGDVIGMLYIGELEQVYDDIRTRTVALNLAVVLGIMALAWVVIYRASAGMIRQIESLDSATKRFERGDLSARADITTQDEIGDLADSFNNMAAVIEQDHRQLIEQKREIEQVNANYLQMLEFVTHELRGTLSSALLNVRLLKDGSYGEVHEDQDEGIGLVEDSLTYLDEITQNYLQLSRIERGELVVNRTSVRVRRDVVQPVLRAADALLDQRGMRVEVAIAEDLEVPADINLLRVVYENLIGNAIKYGREGGLIELDARIEGPLVWLSVWNDGQPIPDDRMPLLFRRFQRFDVNESGGRRGTGLGLFIVKQIVSVHGGEVRVDSDADRGTRFSFSLLH